MRVLQVIPTVDTAAGGPSSSVVNAAIAEAQTGLDVTLVFSEAPSRPRQRERRTMRMLDAEVSILGFQRLPWPGRAGAWGLSPKLGVWLIRNMRSFDVVHLQYVWCVTTVLGSMLGRCFGRPVVLTPHESLTNFDIEITSGNPVKRSLKKLLRKWILSNVDTVVYASELEREDSQGIPQSCRTIYLPVVGRTPEVPISEPQNTAIHMGFLGRIHPKKNLHVIIEALAELNGDASPYTYRLLVAGRGDPHLERDLRCLSVDLGVDSQVTWLGFVNPSQREEFFRSIHVLLMPSRYESFGISAAEAMALGVPVIVSRRTGVAKLVEEFDAGTVLTEPNVAELAAAIRSFSGTPSRRIEYRNRSLKAVEESLTFDVYGREIGQLYEELCEPEKSG